jgi:putative membrane protein
MSEPRRRPPQVFDVGDPAIVKEVEPPPEPSALATAAGDSAGAPETEAPGSVLNARAGWGALLIGALTALAGLAFSLWLTSFLSHALARQDWVGWTAWGLAAIALFAAAMIVLREMFGLMRLNRLAHLRRDADAALKTRDAKAERQVLRRLRSTFSGRPDLAWGMARLKEHEDDVRDPGDLLALADRELMSPLDREARRLILAAAKRVSLVTALSPIALIAVGFVLTENLRLLRRLATLYGGRPGFLGGMRLARAVFVHMVATGGIALTDDIIGQFIGHDLVQRLSRRLGEGLFNGALTARVGTAAIEVCRPLPYVEATPVRLRDIVAELTRRAPRTDKAAAG